MLYIIIRNSKLKLKVRKKNKKLNNKSRIFFKIKNLQKHIKIEF